MMSNERANEIAREIRNNDKTNIGELYKALNFKFNYMASDFNNSVGKEDKQDIFHEEFEKLIENIDTFDESKSGFITYFLCISKRRLIKYAKSSEVIMKNNGTLISNTYEKDGEVVLLSDLCMNINHRCCEEEVLAKYDAKNMKEVLTNAIASLNDNYRMVWELIYREGLKNEAIGKRLGYPTTTIENWYKRGKAKLAGMPEVRALINLEELEGKEEHER